MLLHLVIFASVSLMLAAAATWIIFLRMLRESMKVGEIKEKERIF